MATMIRPCDKIKLITKVRPQIKLSGLAQTPIHCNRAMSFKVPTKINNRILKKDNKTKKRMEKSRSERSIIESIEEDVDEHAQVLSPFSSNYKPLYPTLKADATIDNFEILSDRVKDDIPDLLTVRRSTSKERNTIENKIDGNMQSKKDLHAKSHMSILEFDSRNKNSPNRSNSPTIKVSAIIR